MLCLVYNSEVGLRQCHYTPDQLLAWRYVAGIPLIIHGHAANVTCWDCNRMYPTSTESPSTNQTMRVYFASDPSTDTSEV